MSKERFADVICAKFIGKLDELFEREKKEKDFLSQELFGSCRERAEAWLKMAYEQSVDEMANDAGYAIAAHRGEEHGDETSAEQLELLAAGADPKMMAARGFWT